jgi:hypothetical protein
LLRTRRERPKDGRTAERGHEMPSSDADCHLTPRRDHARCHFLGKAITPQPPGL